MSWKSALHPSFPDWHCFFFLIGPGTNTGFDLYDLTTARSAQRQGVRADICIDAHK